MLRFHRSQLLPDPGTRLLSGEPTARRNRFRDALGAAGVLLIVVMAVFQVYDVLRRLEIVLETEQHRFLNLVRTLGEQTANTLQTVDVLLREAVEDASAARMSSNRAAMESRLRARIAGLPQIVSLTIEQPGPRNVALTPLDAQALSSVQARNHAGIDPAMSGLYVYDSTHRSASEPGTIALARRIYDKDDRLVRLAVAELSVDYFQRLYSGIDLGPGSAVTLFRVDGGGVIARFAADRRAEDAGTEVALLQRLMMASGRAAVAMLANPTDGHERIYAVQAVPGFALAIGASVDKSAVLSPWHVQVMHSAVRTTLLCASVALLIWLVLRQLRRRERAERRLLVQTALLDELFESAPEAIVMTDPQQRIIRVNREFTAMFGYGAHESQGHRLSELIVPQDLQGHPDSPPAASDEHTIAETERIRKDGRRLHVSMLAAPILTGEGQIASYAIFRDITERKLAEAERAKLEARLRQAAKLEAIGRMAGGIAHDFGSVLTAILSYGDMAFQAAAPGDPVRRHVERVMGAAHRAKALINQILTYSRSTHGKRYLMRICETVDEALLLVRASLPANVELRIRLAAPDARVMADATQIHQLLMNLSSNAVQAMASGGALDVSVEAIDISADRRLSHGLLPAGRYVRLSVADAGSGMDAETIPHVFEPFFTTKDPGSGTGLGLALVYGIVTELGGAAHVTSRPGAGATFDLYIPRAEAGEDAARGSNTLLPRGQGQRVLLVEDEKPLMLLAEEMLAALNFEPAGFTRTSEALAEFRVDPSRFDLVIVDHLLPEGTGIEFAREVRRARADAAVILLSAYSGPLLTQEATSAGIQRILTKPLELEVLAEALAELLAANSAH
jgi:PAS domain S-box-containing protein